jgi:hypothetical protein
LRFIATVLGISACCTLAFGQGRSTVEEFPPPPGTTLIHSYLLNDDPNQYMELFAAPRAMADSSIGMLLVTARVNDGKDILNMPTWRFTMKLEGCKRYWDWDGEPNIEPQLLSNTDVPVHDWQRVVPWIWESSGGRVYDLKTNVYDIIGTELCLAHSPKNFSQSLQRAYAESVSERTRVAAEQEAERAARLQAEEEKAKACRDTYLSLKPEIAEVERADDDFSAWARRLTIAKGALEVQQKILQAYQPSAAAINEFQNDVARHNADEANYQRKLAAHLRTRERLKARVEAADTACS